MVGDTGTLWLIFVVVDLVPSSWETMLNLFRVIIIYFVVGKDSISIRWETISPGNSLFSSVFEHDSPILFSTVNVSVSWYFFNNCCIFWLFSTAILINFSWPFGFEKVVLGGAFGLFTSISFGWSDVSLHLIFLFSWCNIDSMKPITQVSFTYSNLFNILEINSAASSCLKLLPQLIVSGLSLSASVGVYKISFKFPPVL